MASRACRRAPAAQLGRVAGQHPGLGGQRRRRRVDRDPGCGEPGGQEVGQCVRPGRGRRMMRAGDAAGDRGGPGDEQDPAGPRFPHGACRALGEQERGAQVHRRHLIELGGGDVLQRLEMARRCWPAQHIGRARRFGGRLDELTGGLRAAQAGADRGRGAAGRGDLRRQCLGGLAVGGLAEPRHGPAGGRPAWRRLPDAAARAGDQRDPAAEWSVHACGPVTPDGRSHGAWRQEGAGGEVTRRDAARARDVRTIAFRACRRQDCAVVIGRAAQAGRADAPSAKRYARCRRLM